MPNELNNPLQTSAAPTSSTKKCPWQAWRTMDDTSKLQTNQLLLETSSRVNDAFIELCAFLDSLDDELKTLSSSKRKNERQAAVSRIRSKLRRIHHPVLPMVYVAVETIQDAALTLAPMGSTLQLHERNEARRKSELVYSREEGCRMQMMGDFLEKSRLNWVDAVGERCVSSRQAFGVQDVVEEGADLKMPALPPMQLGGEDSTGARGDVDFDTNLNARVKFQDESNDESTNEFRTITAKDAKDCAETLDVDASESNLNKNKTNGTSKKRQLTSKESKLTTQKKSKKQQRASQRAKDFPLPPPAKGNQYTKPEAVSIARSYPKDTNARGSAMQAMIDMGYVPNSKRTIQRLVKLAEDEGKPVPDTPWASSNGGAPAILGNSDIDAIVARVIEKNARISGKDDIVEMLVHAAKAKMKQRGEDPGAAKTQFSNGVIHNYWVIFKSKLPQRYFAPTIKTHR